MYQIAEADPDTDFTTLFNRGLAVGPRFDCYHVQHADFGLYGFCPAAALNWLRQRTLTGVRFLIWKWWATEIVRSLAGSIGLTLAIPITAFTSAFLFVQAAAQRQRPEQLIGTAQEVSPHHGQR